MSFQADSFQNDAFQIDAGGGGSSAWMWGLVPPEVSRSKPFRPIWDRAKPLPPLPTEVPKGEPRVIWQKDRAAAQPPPIAPQIIKPLDLAPQDFDEEPPNDADAHEALEALEALAALSHTKH